MSTQPDADDKTPKAKLDADKAARGPFVRPLKEPTKDTSGTTAETDD